MALHDWSRVDASVFHDFHNGWLIHLRAALNRGILPDGYYALSEQHAGRYLTDVLTLHAGPRTLLPPLTDGGIGLMEAPPRVRRKLKASTAARSRRRTLTIRHVSGHRIVALVEVASPANKDRRQHVEEFANKVEDAIAHGIHVLVVDLFQSGTHDPQGLHGVIWERFSDELYTPPESEPLTLASYVADQEPTAYLEHAAIGASLPDMPVFLDTDRYITAPLDSTYQVSFQEVPQFWRHVLEK